MQRVASASVSVDDTTIGSIDSGLLVLLGVTHDDTQTEAKKLANKLWTLRIMRDEQSVADTSGSILVISQFTLYGNAQKGRRPSWTAAAPGPVAEPLYEHFCQTLRSLGATVATGAFGTDMAVSLINDGPVTLLLEA